MRKNILTISNLGFSLLEITIVLIIISILLSAVIPVLSRSYLEKAANKTALDISVIQEASRKYYIDNNQWPAATNLYPTPIAALQGGGYLPNGWNATNPFVNYEPDLADFNYHISTNSSSLTVFTNVPSDALPIIENLLPTPSIDATGTGHNVYSTVPVPGTSGSLPTGSIIPWPSTSMPAGGGYLVCDGTIYQASEYPALASVLGNTYGGDGISTFGVPNLQGKTIFGYQLGDANFGAIGQKGGSKLLIVPSIRHISNRGGSVPYGIDSEPVDDNSGGTDFSEHNLANVPVVGAADASSSLPPYVTMMYIIKY